MNMPKITSRAITNTQNVLAKYAASDAADTAALIAHLQGLRNDAGKAIKLARATAKSRRLFGVACERLGRQKESARQIAITRERNDLTRKFNREAARRGLAIDT